MNEGTYILIECESRNKLPDLERKVTNEFGVCDIVKRGRTLLIPVPNCGYRFALKQLRAAVTPAKVKMFEYESENGKTQRIYYDFSA